MKKIYYEIYEDLREKIIEGMYPFQTYIPSELQLVEMYECSHNTVRKALSVLASHGFVQPIRGKGVIVIWQPRRRTRFELGGIETFQEAAKRCGLEPSTRVRLFERVVATRQIAELTGFAEGAELVHLERIRHFDGADLILDKSYFLAQCVSGITREIAEQSIFTYLEDVLGMQIATSNRTITMEYATTDDREALDLLDFDMLAVVENHTFNSDGVMFEVTQNRHRPDYFTFSTTAMRGL